MFYKLQLITLLCSPLFGFSQLTSYQENYYAINMAFDMTIAKGFKVIIISAKEDYELQMSFGNEIDLEKKTNSAFESVDCRSCRLVSSHLSKEPIKEIFDDIEYQDVYVIQKLENDYKIDLYQGD